MAHRFRTFDFTVSVEGRFVAPGLWMIHAVIEYGDHLSIHARWHVAPEARLELLRGVIGESRRAWSLGAESVRVLVEGDHQVAGFFEVLSRGSVPAIVA